MPLAAHQSKPITHLILGNGKHATKRRTTTATAPTSDRANPTPATTAVPTPIAKRSTHELRQHPTSGAFATSPATANGDGDIRREFTAVNALASHATSDHDKSWRSGLTDATGVVATECRFGANFNVKCSNCDFSRWLDDCRHIKLNTRAALVATAANSTSSESTYCYDDDVHIADDECR